MKTRQLHFGYFLLSSFLLCFLSCVEQHDESLLIGQWKTDSWIINSSNARINNKMDFNFNADGYYELDYGSKKEKGKYWISNDFLHTQEVDMAEKKVKLNLLVQDSIIFEMNRGGRLETVILVKR